MPVDQFGLVRCGEIVRTMSAWLQANWHDEQIPFWGIAARFVVNEINEKVTAINGALSTIASRKIVREQDIYSCKPTYPTDFNSEDLDDFELNWSVNLRIGHNSGPIPAPTEHNYKNAAVDAIRFRAGLRPPETEGDDAFGGDDLDGDDSGMRLILCFTLREDISSTETTPITV